MRSDDVIKDKHVVKLGESGSRLHIVLKCVSNWGMEARKPGIQHHMGNLTLLLANNKGANQAALPRSQISAFVIRYLKVRYLAGGLQHD